MPEHWQHDELVDEGYVGSSDEDFDSDEEDFVDPPHPHDFCRLSFGNRDIELCVCEDEGLGVWWGIWEWGQYMAVSFSISSLIW